MYRHSLLLAIVLLCAPIVRAELSEKDQQFVKNAAVGGMMEVDLGKLAAEKASMDDVKKFGQQMVDDHSKANGELKQLAQSKGVDLKESEEKATREGQEKSAKLSKFTGPAFDKAYMDDMVEDHEKDVKEFEDASNNAQDKDLKEWVKKTLPTLKHHLKMAKDTQDKLKKTAK